MTSQRADGSGGRQSRKERSEPIPEVQPGKLAKYRNVERKRRRRRIHTSEDPTDQSRSALEFEDTRLDKPGSYLEDAYQDSPGKYDPANMGAIRGGDDLNEWYANKFVPHLKADANDFGASRWTTADFLSKFLFDKLVTDHQSEIGDFRELQKQSLRKTSLKNQKERNA